jgi:hypothetical protein
MIRYQLSTFQSIARRLRPSPTSIAGAAAVYEPWLLLQLTAMRREKAGT